ncbi:uncharacterized protein LOC115076472 isoform X2 [Rhinatrema bivittatum]|uniref:uncharacterized protein LOC115076472 isoform X2 n=1 Tax=Rhinatrema bivittatum TaxID=194408 RepID=UPI00112DD771|nr:uncharacterized protein LOC115076472 isoform X2 [Rhinatrema bivittatum]
MNFLRRSLRFSGRSKSEREPEQHGGSDSEREKPQPWCILDFDVKNESDPHPCVTVLLVGAGSRGKCYSYFAVEFSKRMKIVGVVDPRAYPREDLQKMHRIDESNLFEDWSEAVEREKFADAVIIATPDKLHKDPAIAFAKKGYHILLEKPMAVTAEDCEEIVSVCKESGVMLAVGHVMRYYPVSQKIKEIIDSGMIGDVVHIQHMEPVGHWHFAHSFVRGNWRNEQESTFSLLAKSCHDIDLINFWMAGKRCLKVSSFGHLSHFTKEHKPVGAASRCLDCSVEQTCPYSAKKIYLVDHAQQGMLGWPVNVVCSNSDCDIESLTEALKTGPYGRCAYECDNDVVTNQVVNMEFEGGVTVAFTMMAFTHAMGARRTTIYGTKGELSNVGRGPVEVYEFLTKKRSTHPVTLSVFIPSHLMGHGGADYFILDNFVSAVGKNEPSRILTGPDETLRSHLLVFEAEKSRKENRTILLENGREKV